MLPFTDAVVNALVSQAMGTPSNTLTISALEMAAGSYSWAFAGCDVQAPERIQAALSPSVLALIARDLIRRGESIHVIEVTGGGVGLVPAGSWDVRGGWREDDWSYRLDLFGPSGNITRLVTSAGVVHCRYAVDASRPWIGLSPLQ